MAEIIDQVTFLYVKMQKPVFKYQSTTDSEWTVNCVLSKAAAKAWKKQFPKNKVKEFDNDEFTEKYGIDLPFPEQDEQFIITVKRDCKKGDYECPEQYRPRVIEQQGDKRVDVTFEKLVGNGSKGKVSYNLREVKDEVFPQLSAILVEDLVEYEGKTASAGAGTEFGATQAAVPAGNDKKVVTKQTDANEEDFDSLPSAAPSKPKKTVAKAVVEDDADMDSPF